jgi:hypothetical protein
VTGDYNVYSRKGGVDLYFHTFVLWASDWEWIEQTLNSHRSPLKTEVFLSVNVAINIKDIYLIIYLKYFLHLDHHTSLILHKI